MINIGDVLAGKYRVLAELGAGGMGCVYRAENMLTGKQVALKCLHSHLAAGADSSARLLREARAVASLAHSNVVDVYDVIRDGETLFLVMELLRGETLRAYLGRTPQPKISEFLALILPAMSGVEAAHQCGVIHRDLKPENIFLAQVGGIKHVVVKVLDFGIAKLALAPGATLTRSGAALGTPLYMSLEQLRGDKDVDQRADVYAFGVMLYEAVTGTMPYDAETLPELAIKVATTDAPSVKSLRNDVPTALARLVDWAVARDRNKRLPNLQTLQQELELFAHERTFREQMTEKNDPVPRLAAAPSVTFAEATPSTAESRSSPAATRAQKEPALRPDADTLRASEVARGPHATTPGWLRPRWVVVGAALASGLVAGSLWLQEQAALSDAPSQAETKNAAALLDPASSERPTPAPAGRPSASPSPNEPSTVFEEAPASATSSAPEPAPRQLEVSVPPTAVSESAKKKILRRAEMVATKVPLSAPPKHLPPARIAAPAVQIQKRPAVTPAESNPPAVQAVPINKDPRDLIGF
jgi:serine/threonine-protein kinase